jgi:2-amino-4-hydroxy-6-hydroxymethyldihydropteridine diphosphokinase
MQAVVYIGVGSNVNPQRNITAALEGLSRELEVTHSSTFYWSEAVARAGQPPFLNGVWRARTEREPRALKFEVLRPLERRLGRRRSADRHAPRPIDLDLLLHGAARCEEADLVLPDPDIPRRAFLWMPLLELAPELEPDLGPLRRPAPGELRADPAFTLFLRDALSTKPSHEH